MIVPRFVLLLSGLSPLLLACSPSDASSQAAEASADAAPAPSRQAVETDVLNLIAAFTPLSATAPPGEQSAWYGRRHDTIESMREESHAHGLEALKQYQARLDTLPEIRAGLLDAAAHAAPEETRPVLALLVTEYGDNMLVRTKAAGLLGDTSPEHALEILEPILRHEKTGRTYPREEHMLRGWLSAMQTLGRDPVDLLCTVALDLPREIDVRHFATKQLGKIESDHGRQALEQLLTESTGNHMLRRFAAQSLQSSLSGSAFCDLITPVMQNEADMNFQVFLANMRDANCR